MKVLQKSRLDNYIQYNPPPLTKPHQQHLDQQVSYTTLDHGKRLIWAKLQHNNDTLNTGGDRQYM